MASATITSKGQITIPKAIREVLGVAPGDRVTFVRHADGRIVVEPETVDVRSLRGLLRRDGPPVSLAQMDEAIAEEAGS